MSGNGNIVIGFVTDLFTRVSIESSIESLGFEVIWWDDISGFVEASQLPLPGNKGEHLSGPGYLLTNELTQLQPAALIFDLGDEKVPWDAWISMLKSASATRRIPVLSFGPHVDTEMLAKAKKAGSDMVVPRSALAKKLPQFFEQHSTIHRIDENDKICQREIHPLAMRGIEAFNNNQYFDAHEHFEDAWMELEPREGVLYRSLLQVSVIYYHIRAGNYAGAIKVYLRVRQWLAKLPDRCQGVNVRRVKDNLEENIRLLKSLGEERMAEFDLTRIKKIELL